jgi:hypothetical protein
MTTTALVLLALAGAAPVLALLLERAGLDAVVLVALLSAVLLSGSALAAWHADEASSGQQATAAVLGVVAAVAAGSLVVRAVFRLTRGELLPRPVDSRASVSATEDVTGAEGEPEQVLRGGAWIGYLERAGTGVTLLAGFPEGVAILIAVKGLGRYAELKQSNAPEAFIIGTLASLLWAYSAVGVAVLLR